MALNLPDRIMRLVPLADPLIEDGIALLENLADPEAEARWRRGAAIGPRSVQRD